MQEQEVTTLNIPALALRGMTVFPKMTATVDVEREISIRALERAMENDLDLFLVAQKEVGVNSPKEEDLYTMGTVATVRQVLRISESAIRILVEGKSRAQMKRLWQTEPYLQVNVELIGETLVHPNSEKLEALLRQTYVNVHDYYELSPRLNEELLGVVADSRDPGYVADYIAQNTMLRHQDKQVILEELRPMVRLQRVNELLAREIDIINFEQEIEGKIRQHVGEVQKDHILREQMQVIRRELGESDEDNELQEYRDKIKAAGLSDEVEEKLLKEVSRLSKQPFGSAEGSVIRNYLDVCLDMPWNVTTK